MLHFANNTYHFFKGSLLFTAALYITNRNKNNDKINIVNQCLKVSNRVPYGSFLSCEKVLLKEM